MISRLAVGLSVFLFLVAAAEEALLTGNTRVGVLYFFIAGTNAAVLWVSSQ